MGVNYSTGVVSPNTATSGPPSGSPSGQPSDQDASSPLLIDYLKTRCYLYKFTPNIVYGGANGQQNVAPTSLQKNLNAQVASQQIMANTLIALMNALNGIGQVTSATNRFDTNIVNAGNLLAAFLNLPNVQSGNLNVGTATQLPIDPTTLSEANALKNWFFTGSGFTFGGGSINSWISAVTKWLAGTIYTLQVSIDTEQSQTAPQLAAQQQLIEGALSQFQVSRFTYDLNVADLTRYDISKFMSGYTIDQQLGNVSAVGFINGSATLQNAIIPLQDLQPVPGPTAVRRPIFFPNANGDYPGYTNGLPVAAALKANNPPILDPMSQEPISTLQSVGVGNENLITRIAILQTLEDNGGGNGPPTGIQGFNDAYLADAATVEIAIRLRGISNPRKRELIVKYFSTGTVDDELVRLVAVIGSQPSLSNMVATAQLQAGPALGLPGSLASATTLTAAQQKIKNKLTSKPGQVGSQLDDLQLTLSDPRVDGITLGDLIQKYDFFSIFVYKHEVSPDVVESTVQGITNDPNFFDKESLFIATPVTFLLNQADNRNFAMYSPEINGFVVETSYTSTPSNVNTITVNLMGSMGLMGATKRVYNSTIFQQSVFDAAELMDSSIFNLYQNLYQGKDPLQILTILLDSLYMLRVVFPKPAQQITLDPIAAQTIATNLTTAAANAVPPVAPGSAALTTAITNAQALALQQLQLTTLGGKVLHDNTGNLFSYFDILSLRAFDQFNMTGDDGVFLGPLHLFNMASFLYANVMRSRKFNVRVATQAQVNELDPEYGGAGVSPTGTFPYYITENGSDLGAFQPFTPTAGVLTYLPKEADGSGGSVLEINPLIDTSTTNPAATVPQALAWKSYFVFLTASLGNFVADLKTPFEIMNDVANSCYLELYETPGGRFVFRTPQYNNNIALYQLNSQSGTVTSSASPSLVTSAGGTTTLQTTTSESFQSAHMLTSSDIIVISTQYNQTVKNLISKQAMAYGADLIGVPIEQLYYFYSNGKMVSQYGLSLGSAVENPNVRAIPRAKLLDADLTSQNSTYMMGVFHYCRFFLEYTNMNNFTATITAVGDPAIEAGRTYFDIENQKFGYISHVTKELSVGSTYTCTFQLTAVRDACYGAVPAPQGNVNAQVPLGVPVFRILPEMEDFIPKFTGSVVDLLNLSPIQFSKAPPVSAASILVYNGPIGPSANSSQSMSSAVLNPYNLTAPQPSINAASVPTMQAGPPQ